MSVSISSEVGEVLIECGTHIARWAKTSENGGYAKSPDAARDRENAWRVLAHLIIYAEHIKEADLYWKLGQQAIEEGKPKAEQQRVMTIAGAELREGRQAKEALEKLLQECLAEEAGFEANAAEGKVSEEG